MAEKNPSNGFFSMGDKTHKVPMALFAKVLFVIVFLTAESLPPPPKKGDEKSCQKSE
jgi:hypothetical protein